MGPQHNMQAIVSLALVAAATAAPQYAKAPAGYAAPDLAEPSPYTYQYAVADDYSKANFQQSESNDGTGVVTGSYSVNLPDGRTQHVAYHANDYDGNVAEVTYTGEAQYPPAAAGGYAAAPVHAVHAVHAPVHAVHAVHAPVHAVHAPVHAVHAVHPPVHAVHAVAHPVAHHGLIGGHGLVHHG